MRIASRSVWAAVLAVAAVSTVHARSLREQLGASSLTVGLAGGSAFDALAANIADSAARSLPVVSASAGFTYRYDRDLETFVRTSDTLGPIFLERPETLHVTVTGDAAVVTVPIGHTVKLKRDGGVWRVDDFD